MNLLRCTVIDPRGAVSFIVEGEALSALTAACARNPDSLETLLEGSERFYEGLRERVLNGLAIFDERNAGSNHNAVHAALDYCEPYEQPVFRVVDDRTREESLRPVKAGAVIFNLPAKRIIQLQNSYREIRRAGRARVVSAAGPTNRLYSYRLPKEWSLVP